MRYLDLIEQSLTEMVVRHKTDSTNHVYVVAHRDSIWLFDTEADGDNEDLIRDIGTRTGMVSTDLQGLIDETNDSRPDILLGMIYGKTLHIQRSHQFIEPQSSLLVKKTVAQLGLRGVSYNDSEFDGDDFEIEHHRSELLGRIPEVVYHGTNSRHIYSILRRGLVPVTGHGNWEHHKYDKVFLTANFGYACFHANRQASASKTTPIVIGTRLPERSRIQFDFDVAATFVDDPDVIARHGYTKGIEKSGPFTRGQAKAIAKFSPKTDFTRESGIFAYNGRVPASFFATFSIPSNNGDEFNALKINSDDNITLDDPRELMRAMEMIDNFGFYDPNYDPSEDEEEDESDWRS